MSPSSQRSRSAEMRRCERQAEGNVTTATPGGGATSSAPDAFVVPVFLIEMTSSAAPSPCQYPSPSDTVPTVILNRCTGGRAGGAWVVVGGGGGGASVVVGGASVGASVVGSCVGASVVGASTGGELVSS